jgi:hypothetical protein
VKLIDIGGNQYGKLFVVRQTKSNNKSHSTAWLCSCVCGKNKIVSKTNLLIGKTIDCGCGTRRRRGIQNTIDLIGLKFGSLIVVSRSADYSRHGRALWVCKCICGDTVEYDSHQLRINGIGDCGCSTFKRKLNKQQFDFVVGTLLGDGCLARRTKYANLRVSHSIKQEQFVRWKHKILYNIAGDIRITNNRGFGKQLIGFQTPVLSQLTELHNVIYPNKIKTVTAKWLSFITDPLSLAVWYMDDGSMQLRNGSTSFHTEGFKKPEVQLLCNWLYTKWDIPCGICEYRGYCRISLKADGRRQLHNIVRPHIIPEMRYKINHRYDDICD